MRFILRPSFILSTITGLLSIRKSTRGVTGYIKLIPWVSWVLLLVFQYVVYKSRVDACAHSTKDGSRRKQTSRTNTASRTKTEGVQGGTLTHAQKCHANH